MSCGMFCLCRNLVCLIVMLSFDFVAVLVVLHNIDQQLNFRNQADHVFENFAPLIKMCWRFGNLVIIIDIWIQ
ncbi:hypothetical protein HUG17_7143 [Dermatophagoides farinae]|uniref:Uncharacterized protein n=1 Tax=Dermatophagoides farinae TaxID=6954 RepID=A0A9D4SC60_DERFA|nr:hypothetical protein HUG17_7143 [Dermatophagoides farinae]